MTLAIIFFYLVLQFALGYYISRLIKSEDDYLVGGRRLGFWLTTFSIFATWFGAETCIGAAGRVYDEGLSGGIHDPFGYGICILFMGLFIARPIWRLKLTTLGDLIRLKYGAEAERLGAILMIPTSLLWAAAQIRAFGQILSILSGLDITLMITCSAAFIIAYTYLGGLLADAWTDLLQGVILVVGLMLLVYFLIQADVFSSIGSLGEERLQLESRGIWSTIEAWSVPIIGSLVAAELISKVIAARSGAIAIRSSMAAFVIYTTIGLIPVLVGLVGVQHFTSLEDSELILPLMAERFLPQGIYVVFIGALLSAIIATVDSALLVCGGLTSHNIILPVLNRNKKQTSEHTKLQLARFSVVGYGIVAYVLAVFADGVYELVVEASSFGSAGLVVVVLFALYGSEHNPTSAILALLSGVLTYIIAQYFINFEQPFTLSLMAALIGYLVPRIRIYLRPS